jgi:hypothetical protein
MPLLRAGLRSVIDQILGCEIVHCQEVSLLVDECGIVSVG